MTTKWNLKSKLRSLIFLQVVFFIVLIIAYFLTSARMERTSSVKQKHMEEMNQIKYMTMKIKDFVNGQMDFDELKDYYQSIKMTTLDTVLLETFNTSWENVEGIEKNLKENIKIEKDVMKLTNASIENSNSFINAMSSALADNNKRHQVSTLERLVIGGANANNNNNYKIQVLFKKLKEDIKCKNELLDFLDAAIKNTEQDIKNLANTPFAQLPVDAHNANVKMKSLVVSYCNNVEENIQANNSLIAKTNELYDILIQSDLQSTNAIVKSANASIINLIIILLVISIIAVAINYNLIHSISGFFKRLIVMIDNLKEGNLTMKFSNKELIRKDEFGDVYKSVQAMVDKLNDLIRGIVTSSENVNAASLQLGSVSQEVSQGASEQAASLEQVSSSIEEMSVNIQQNTENSGQTEKISQNAMKGIKDVNGASEQSLESVRNITEKIQIINDIAFQTNILALNAAVEAARAGEHGKGFAVVAAEVRKLAERSKIAADEIVDLAHVSRETTERSGELMQNLIPEIEKTAKMIQEIAASSAEQYKGVELINSTLQQLNNITQQNAASSEEMATSSEELSSQSEQLKQMIGFFNYDELSKVDSVVVKTANDKKLKEKQINNSDDPKPINYIAKE